MSDREFDVVLYGATGFTGRLAVAYFARHSPAGFRWAIAGRDLTKLKSIEANVPILVFDSSSQAGVDAAVARTRVLLSTAGPFREYSDALVDACVRLRTHYIDISGESVRIRDLIDRYHQRAAEAQVRIVTLCGFSSAPADLAVYLLNKSLAGHLAEARGFFQMGGGSFNGGTISSMANAHATGDVERERDPFLLVPGHRGVAERIEHDAKGVLYDRVIRAWTAPSPMATSDICAIHRSAALDGYEVRYKESMAFPGLGGLIKALGFAAVLRVLDTMMRNEVTRRLLQRLIPPGSGPSEKEMDAAWFELRVCGTTKEGPKAEAVIRGQGDASNRITVKCVCEGAIAMVLDEAALPAAYGILTPSAAFGDVLVQRLAVAGLEIRVIGLP